MSEIKSISIVILEYKSLRELKELINSLIPVFKNLKIEIIIVSNSCYSKQEQQKLEKEYKNCIWIFNKKNKGFAGGVNTGLRRANNEYILYLNTDAKYKKGNILDLLEYFSNNKNIGVIGPKIIDKNDIVQDSARRFQNPLIVIKRTVMRILFQKNSFPEVMDYNKIFEVDWVCGAAMFFKVECLRKINYFDEKYFLYFEEVDLCKRVWDSKYKVVYYPNFIIEYCADRKSMDVLFGKFNLRAIKFLVIEILSYCRFLFKHGINPKRK